PGDFVTLDLTNDLHVKPNAAQLAKQAEMMRDMPADMPHSMEASLADPCKGGMMTINSTNVHFHGLNIPPVCHQDEVVTTLIQPGPNSFRYKIQIPANEPPGLYWYHPHPHGFTTLQVNGGASGAIIVGGIEKIKPQVAGLTERVLIIRQQFLSVG